jgi:hypothetical protein
MAYLGKTPSQAVRSRYYFTASGGETSLAPAQVTGLSFTDANYVDVSLNGVALVSGTDYTATPSTNTISSLSALTASDVVEIVVYDTFSVFGGSVNGDFTISNGTLAAEAVTVTGLTTTGNINFGDNDKAIFGAGSDLQIYHDASDSYIVDGGTGNLRIQGEDIYLMNAAGTEVKIRADDDSFVKLYFDNAEKLATTSTGVDVTGTVTADGLTMDTSANSAYSAIFGANRTGAGTALGLIKGSWNGTTVAQINLLAGSDTTNKDDGRIQLRTSNSGGSVLNRFQIDENGDTSFYADDGSTQALFFDASTQRLGLGTTSPEGLIGLPATASNTPKFRLQSASTNTDFAISSYADANGTYVSLGANHYLDSGGNDAVFETTDRSAYVLLDARNNGMVAFGTNSSGVATERMRIDGSGNVLVNQSSTTSPGFSNTTTGLAFSDSGRVFSSASGAASSFNRNTSDGGVIHVRKAGTLVGVLGVTDGDNFSLDCQTSSHSGLTFGTANILPRVNGSNNDGNVDLGSGSNRFQNIYATNATIQTSDESEKQNIAGLTSAEITAAKAISKLFKTFKWKYRVAAEGDAARTHTGVIAQEVQTAMTDAGLDAADYAFWCSDTWWETSTEVAAVEADEEAAIEAKDAYTRIDTYQTADEAPEGATQRTRMGIRYPELLAFIGAATEQRLGDIETRLTALENAE